MVLPKKAGVIRADFDAREGKCHKALRSSLP